LVLLQLAIKRRRNSHLAVPRHRRCCL